MTPFQTRTWAEIDPGALRHNLEAIRTAVGTGPSILAVVKANAYGHGAEAVAVAISDSVEYFGVACLDEARPLASLGRDIFLLSPCLPEERAEAVAAGYIVTVSSADEAAGYSVHGPCRVNFKIDTGMGRLGCTPESAAGELQHLLCLPGIHVHSISSHLPVSDEDTGFTASQLAHLAALRTSLKRLAPQAKWHVLNSAGIFLHPTSAMDIVRGGLALYGVASPSSFQSRLRPAMAWKARVLHTKEIPAGTGVSYGRTFIAPHPMRIASVSVGYADGYPRQLSGRGADVLISGSRCRVLGRITMDQTLVDVSGISADPGDEVVLLGTQGQEEISAAELATKAGTIAWHLFTGLSTRVRRRLT